MIKKEIYNLVIQNQAGDVFVSSYLDWIKCYSDFLNQVKEVNLIYNLRKCDNSERYLNGADFFVSKEITGTNSDLRICITTSYLDRAW